MPLDKDATDAATKTLDAFAAELANNTRDVLNYAQKRDKANAVMLFLFTLSEALNGPQIDKDSDVSDLALGLFSGFQAGLEFASQCHKARENAVKHMMKNISRDDNERDIEEAMKRIKSTLDELDDVVRSIDKVVSVYTAARMVGLMATRDDDMSGVMRRAVPEFAEVPLTLMESVAELESQLIRSLTAQQDAQSAKAIEKLTQAEATSRELLDKLRSRNS